MVKEVEEKDYNSDSQYSESQLDSDSTSRIEGSQERARIHRDRASKREGVEGDAHEYNRQSHVSNKGATFPSGILKYTYTCGFIYIHTCLNLCVYMYVCVVGLYV